MSFAHTFLPVAADLPPDVDVDAIVAGLASDHVYAPDDVESEIATLVAEARDDGIQLSVVVIPENGRHDSLLRNLATEVASHEHGTVLVVSPDWAGTYSDTINRVKLEAGEDHAKYTASPVIATRNFIDELEAPAVSWTAATSVLLAGTVLAVAGLYAVKARRAKSAPPPAEPPSRDPVPSGSSR
ncbi:DUF6676 family protein [Aldersonia kunmingensis]|uniref:Rv1476 family membrane protein n=1 Tax=Aldersonia kunmingensis TaxID=408066 RepID=UPI00082F8B03|nr:DUF6676 family protein [Aldersonia kunmingensis]